MSLSMLCDQCSMSAINGCGSKGQDIGTCGKDANLAKLQTIFYYPYKNIKHKLDIIVGTNAPKNKNLGSIELSWK